MVHNILSCTFEMNIVECGHLAVECCGETACVEHVFNFFGL